MARPTLYYNRMFVCSPVIFLPLTYAYLRSCLLAFPVSFPIISVMYYYLQLEIDLIFTTSWFSSIQRALWQANIFCGDMFWEPRFPILFLILSRSLECIAKSFNLLSAYIWPSLFHFLHDMIKFVQQHVPRVLAVCGACCARAAHVLCARSRVQWHRVV